MNIEQLVKSIKFKHEEQKEDLHTVHGLLFMVLIDMAWWMNSRGYDMVITDLVSTLDKDIALQRESDSHRTKRAADLRCRHMNYEDKEDFKEHFNTKYAHIASVSRSDLKPRLVVDHGNKNNRHFHIALNFKYRIVE